MGRREILLPREEQRHVYRHAGENGLLNGRDTVLVAGNLDEDVGPARPRVELFRRGDGARRVVGEPGRDLERRPAIDAIGCLMSRTEQVGGRAHVLEREFEEKGLAGLAGCRLLADGSVVIIAVLDGMIEDGRIRGKPSDRELVDVALQAATRDESASDVVEPEALAGVVELLRRPHTFLLRPACGVTKWTHALSTP